jgi:hypothetical protein
MSKFIQHFFPLIAILSEMGNCKTIHMIYFCMSMANH